MINYLVAFLEKLGSITLAEGSDPRSTIKPRNKRNNKTKDKYNIKSLPQ